MAIKMDVKPDQIERFEHVGHSPAWQKIPQAMLELRVKGFNTKPEQPPAWNDPCLTWRSSSGQLAGFLVYRYDEIGASWFILLAWVAPDYRRMGIHTALFRALVERAIARGDIISINSGTHVDNHTAQTSLQAQGRIKTAIMYEYRLRDHVNGKPFIDETEG